MLGKDDILNLMLMECDICTHLHGKLPEGGLEYRPSASQRNTLELLRYISFCGIGGARYLVEGGWDGYGEVSQRAAEMGSEEFPAAMERQKEELRGLFAAVSDEDFASKQVKDPMGNEHTLGQALVTMPMRWLGGYRMQLFLYAKAAGNEEIWTPNCWMGMDWERPEPPAE